MICRELLFLSLASFDCACPMFPPLMCWGVKQTIYCCFLDLSGFFTCCCDMCDIGTLWVAASSYTAHLTTSLACHNTSLSASVGLYVCLSLSLSVWLTVCLSVSFCLELTVPAGWALNTNKSVSLSLSLSLSVCLSRSVCLFRSVCLSVCLPPLHTHTLSLSLCI